ncbi:MAG: HAMP domain-containing histidine kinase [Candidatus Eremiobacteraeota bacterium]|nr:HAMP domain-containing histidine kinase [Candidatus Eremiobacteraeota bacterium]
MRSLQVRIVAAIALVCAATLAAVALYVGRATLLVQINPASDIVVARVASSIAPSLRSGHSTEAIRSQLALLGARYGARMVVVNAAAHIALLASGPVASNDLTIQPDGTVALKLRPPALPRRGVIMLRGGTAVVDQGKPTPWRVFMLPSAPPLDVLDPVRDSIINSIWESAAVGFAAALTIAVVLGSSIVKPIRTLTDAAQAVSRGVMTRRAPVRSQDELGRLGSAFNTMADSIETMERSRRVMITDVAHELRSPLTRMIVQLEAAADGHISRDEALSGAHQEARRLERIVNDLRDLSLADAHEISILRKKISMSECIDGAIERAIQKANDAQVSLKRAVAPDLPDVWGDELRVAQILDNLLSNALQYTPAMGRISIGARATPSHVECFVADDGAGIRAEDLAPIFERFYRADPSRSRATGGSGLGLAIVKAFVEAMGGTIRAESGLGNGSCFTWTLPRSEPLSGA